jgi:hypothetical protein
MKRLGLGHFASQSLAALAVAVLVLAPATVHGEEHGWLFQLVIDMAKPKKPTLEGCAAGCCTAGCCATQVCCPFAHCPMGACTGAATMPCCPVCCHSATQAIGVDVQVNVPTLNNPRIVSGLTPAGGTYTPDLGIPINTSSYSCSQPPFEGDCHAACPAARPSKPECVGECCVGTPAVAVADDEGRSALEQEAATLRDVCIDHECALQQMQMVVMQLSYELQMLRMQMQTMQNMQPVQVWAPAGNAYAPRPVNVPFAAPFPPMMAPQLPMMPQQVVPTSYPMVPPTYHPGPTSATPIYPTSCLTMPMPVAQIDAKSYQPAPAPAASEGWSFHGGFYH